MLSTELLEKKKHLDKILNNTNNDFDLFNILRTECDRIDFADKEIILNFEKTKFNIDKKTKKVKKIITYDNDLHKIKEFLF